MSFCSNCGNEVKEGQAICLGCGFALKGNAAPIKESVVAEYDLADRVKHDVFKLWPTFNDGPIGRMDYLKSLLILCAVGIGLVFVIGFTAAAYESNPLMAIPFGIFALVGLVASVIMVAHQVALVYKRFWDMGFNDKGTRVGMTIGYFVVGMIPVLSLACLAVFFIPGRR